VDDSNKQADIHTDDQHVDDIIDSDELFDLDMPLDEPNDNQADALSDMLDDMLEEPDDNVKPIATETSKNPDINDSFQDLMDKFPDNDPQNDENKQAEAEQETLQTVEQDLEHLLNRSDANDQEDIEQAPLPTHAEKNAVSMDTSTLAVTEPATDIPVTEKTNAQPRSGMANSIMLTLGLIAMLVAALGVWLGLDASQQKSQLASVSSNLQQQIHLLEHQQEQQKTLLTQHIETLEKRVNTLTQVIANKTAEQWRASLPHKPARSEKTTTAPTETAGLHSKQAEAPAMPEAASKAVNCVAAKTVPKAKKPAISPATVVKTPAHVKSATHASTTTTPLSMYEVAPGTVKGWVVNIYSVTSRSTAEKRIRQLKAKDINAKYVRVQIKGKTWYRVRASGFKDKHAAATFKKFLQEYYGIDAWYSYLKK
jgi:cell division septation protein DedD